MNVFVEASGSLVSAALIKSLKDAGLRVIVSDITEINAGALLADKYIKVPDKDNKNLWQKIEELLITNEIDWVIPSFDEMLFGWSEREEKFNADGIKLLISPHNTINTFLDKWKTYNAFVQSDLPVPKTSLQKEYPMVKPRQGRGSQGIIITDEIDVDMEDKISQEIVRGTELTVDCFFNKDGTPIYIVPRIRLKVVDGKSVNAQTIQHEQVEQHIKNLAKNNHFIGPVNIQCFINDEDIWFTEVNPRVGGGMALGWAATENWFDLWFNKIILNKPFKLKPIKYGLQMYRYYAEAFQNRDEVQIMKILFIGTVKFSLSALERLLKINSNVVGVCTKNTSLFNHDYADLSTICELNSIPCLRAENLNSKENIEWINNLNPDVIFCFGWSSIINKEILSIPPLGVIGYHPARLPENRGRHPLIWALLMGLETSTSTFFFMNESIDGGEILSQVDFSISYEDDAQSLYDKITGIALEQIENFVPKLIRNDYRLITQNPNASNYLRKRNKDDGLIDFRMSGRAIYNLVRGLTKPYVGAHINYRGENISIWKVKELENFQKNIEPGKVLKIYDRSIVIKCFDKSIEIIEHDFKTLPKVGEFL